MFKTISGAKPIKLFANRAPPLAPADQDGDIFAPCSIRHGGGADGAMKNFRQSLLKLGNINAH